jgi:hypothetical protein
VEEDPHGRIPTAAKEIAARYRASTDGLGTQLVFLDVGVPDPKKLDPLPASISRAKPNPLPDDDEPDSDTADAEAEAEAALEALRHLGAPRDLYLELKRRLIAAGVPSDEIAFIHQATDPSAQARLFQAVREGRVRVLLTTRAKGGTGMNVQDRVIAVHHLDVPWRPDQLEQADGRAVRQGNQNAEVEIVRYVTRKSFDEYKWRLLSDKQSFIAQFYRGELDSMEDIDPTQLDFQMASAWAADDPRVMELIQAERALVGLRARYENFARRQAQSARELKAARESLARYTAHKGDIDAKAAEATAWAEAPHVDLGMAVSDYYGLRGIDPKPFDWTDADARKAFAAALRPIMAQTSVREETIATAGPFLISRASVQREQYVTKAGVTEVQRDSTNLLKVSVEIGGVERTIGSTPEWDAANPPDLVRSLDSYLKPSRLADIQAQNQRLIDYAQQSVTDHDAIASKTFGQHEELTAKTKEVDDLRTALQGASSGAAPLPTSAPAAAPSTPVTPKTSNADRGFTAQSTILPGLKEFVEEDVVPTVAAAAHDLVEAKAGLHALFAPDTVSPAAVLGAGVLRANLAAHTQRVQRAQKTLRALEKAFDRATRRLAKRSCSSRMPPRG